MEIPAPSIFCSLFVIVLILHLPHTSMAEPRSQIVQIICGTQLQHNTTISVSNFVAVMETISQQMRTRGYGVAVNGTGPDTNYGLAQCYGDLSLLDCNSCYAEARTIMPQCFPYNGGRIYLDGCFMRTENYAFYNQYLGPEDRHVCENRTKKGTLFQQNARQAIEQAVANAPSNNGYARAQVSVSGPSNETAYVLADCWKTLSANSCTACLQSASASMLGCLPWSGGRALYTGCFMRYSDTNFLNAISTGGGSSSRGKVVVIVIVVSSVVILGVVAFVGFVVWENKQIQKKRKGIQRLTKPRGHLMRPTSSGKVDLAQFIRVFWQMGERSPSKGCSSTANTELQIFITRLTSSVASITKFDEVIGMQLLRTGKPSRIRVPP